jgi:hypothetical protein
MTTVWRVSTRSRSMGRTLTFTITRGASGGRWLTPPENGHAMTATSATCLSMKVSSEGFDST